MPRLSWYAKVVQQFATELLRHADSAPRPQGLRGHDLQYGLLQLLRLKSGNALGPSFEFRGTFHAMNLVDRKSLGLELSAGYLLLPVNLTLLRDGELVRARLQLTNAFHVTRFRQQLQQ